MQVSHAAGCNGSASKGAVWTGVVVKMSHRWELMDIDFIVKANRELAGNCSGTMHGKSRSQWLGATMRWGTV